LELGELGGVDVGGAVSANGGHGTVGRVFESRFYGTKKNPAEAGFRSRPAGRAGRTTRSATRARADALDLDATVLRAALAGAVVGDGLLLALAFGVDPVGLDALADQVGLDRFGTTNRQLLVVGIGTDTVGVTDGDDHLERDARQLAGQVVEARLAFGLQHGLVEIEEGVGGEGDLLAGRGRGRRGFRRGGRSRSRGGRRSGRGTRRRRRG